MLLASYVVFSQKLLYNYSVEGGVRFFNPIINHVFFKSRQRYTASAKTYIYFSLKKK